MTVKANIGHSPSQMAALLSRTEMKLLQRLVPYDPDGAFATALLASWWPEDDKPSKWGLKGWIDIVDVLWGVWRLKRLGLIYGRNEGEGSFYCLTIRGRLVLHFLRLRSIENNLQTSAS